MCAQSTIRTAHMCCIFAAALSWITCCNMRHLDRTTLLALSCCWYLYALWHYLIFSNVAPCMHCWHESYVIGLYSSVHVLVAAALVFKVPQILHQHSIIFFVHMLKGIVSDSNNMILRHESEDINRKGYFQNFSWFQFYVYKFCMIICIVIIP